MKRQTLVSLARKETQKLVDKINEVLAGLSQEDRDAMMDQAVASQPVSN